MTRRVFSPLFVFAFLVGCGQERTPAGPAPSASESVEVPLLYAKAFRIEKRGPIRVLTVINSWKNGATPARYVLVPKNLTPPPDAAAGEIVRTPIGKYAALSTTHLTAFDELDRLDDLVGFASQDRVLNPKVRARFKSGKTAAVGSGGSASLERIASLGCEALFASDFAEDAPERAETLRRLGVQVILAADFSEEHPLGRAEWIRFFGAFFDEEEKAERLFQHQVDEYKTLAALAANAKNKPTVLLNAPFGGTWHVASGRSTVAKLLADAGARYLWADSDASASLPLQFEAVFAKAAEADYWLNPGQWTSLAEARKEDSRYAWFSAFQRGAVWNCDLKKTLDGGSDYWETGVNHPEKVLADLIAIFHPDLLPNHQMNWYRKLP